MRERLLKQASHEYSPKQRAALLAAAGVLFLVILPWVSSAWADGWIARWSGRRCATRR